MFSKQSFIDLAIVLAVPLVVVGGYFLFGGTSDVSLISEQPTANISPTDPGAKTKLALDTLSGTTLDDSLFRDEAYTSLTEFSAPIPEVPLSRDNPFTPPPIIEERLREARLGHDASRDTITPTNTQTASTQNLQAKIDALKKALK